MSSIYPLWWDTTLTVYNKFVDSQTDVIKWYRHVISGCFWKYTGNKIYINNVTLESDNTICRIPESDLYLDWSKWILLPNDQKPNYFTLGLADIIIRGEVDREIDEYTKGWRSTDFLEQYDAVGCIEVQKVTINIGGGRNNPHYYVQGK